MSIINQAAEQWTEAQAEQQADEAAEAAERIEGTAAGARRIVADLAAQTWPPVDPAELDASVDVDPAQPTHARVRLDARHDLHINTAGSWWEFAIVRDGVALALPQKPEQPWLITFAAGVAPSLWQLGKVLAEGVPLTRPAPEPAAVDPEPAGHASPARWTAELLDDVDVLARRLCELDEQGYYPWGITRQTGGFILLVAERRGAGPFG
ncbi:MAG: hypothetical protein AB7G37_06415 [Solirubrobacteraceae bacterium]